MSRIVAGLLALACLIAQSAASANAAATIVQNRDEPVRNPYQAHAFISSICGLSHCAIFPVIPAGERVVIEFVSCALTLPVGTGPLAVGLAARTINPTEQAYVLASYQGESSPNLVFYTVASPVVFYLAAGETPTIYVFLNGTAGSPAGDCLISGYRVLLP